MENEIKFQSAVNTSKNAGQEGAEVLKDFMSGKSERKPEEMSRNEKRGIRKMAKMLLKSGAISLEKYKQIIEALNGGNKSK